MARCATHDMPCTCVYAHNEVACASTMHAQSKDCWHRGFGQKQGGPCGQCAWRLEQQLSGAAPANHRNANGGGALRLLRPRSAFACAWRPQNPASCAAVEVPGSRRIRTASAGRQMAYVHANGQASTEPCTRAALMYMSSRARIRRVQLQQERQTNNNALPRFSTSCA